MVNSLQSAANVWVIFVARDLSLIAVAVFESSRYFGEELCGIGYTVRYLMPIRVGVACPTCKHAKL